MSSLPFAALGGSSGFASDPRFSGFAPATASAPMPPPDEDPVAIAHAQGYAAGLAEARAEAEAQRAADAQLRRKLELALSRLDTAQEEILRQRLTATIEVLCEATLAPLALDREALAQRVTRAAAMLSRADDEAVLRLHPEDMALIADSLPADLAVEPDPSLERGALRLEGTAGGVEDGPAQWRSALAEALGQW